MPPKSTTEQKKEKSHNKTYCNDWVMTNADNSVSHIQNDFENVANDKTATTLIDVTSVSRNAQPLPEDKEKYFFSKRGSKKKNEVHDTRKLCTDNM